MSLSEDDKKREALFEDIKVADKIQFYLFFFGLYKDHRKVE
jgi:hypothetical protein